MTNSPHVANAARYTTIENCTFESAQPPTFNPGDVVVLKSGGPKMTVTAVHTDHVRVVWFTHGRTDDNCYPKISLQHVAQDSPGLYERD